MKHYDNCLDLGAMARKAELEHPPIPPRPASVVEGGARLRQLPDRTRQMVQLANAAPDLLAACEAALELLREATDLIPDFVPFDDGPVIEQIEAAIAKAKGDPEEELEVIL
jgi:hypothetical protein